MVCEQELSFVAMNLKVGIETTPISSRLCFSGGLEYPIIIVCHACVWCMMCV